MWTYVNNIPISRFPLFFSHCRFFRVVPAPTFLAKFSSDRRHMKKPDGSWMKPPPNYPIIQVRYDQQQRDLKCSCEKVHPLPSANTSSGKNRPFKTSKLSILRVIEREGRLETDAPPCSALTFLQFLMLQEK